MLRQWQEMREKEAEAAEVEIRSLEKEAVQVADQMIDYLINTCDLALKLKATCQKAWNLERHFEDFNLHFHEPIVARFSEDLKSFLSRTIPFSMIDRYPSKDPLRKKLRKNSKI